MVNLRSLLEKIDYIELSNVTDNKLAISGIKISSKDISKGDMFVAIKGAVTDGHNYIAQAIENGATTILYSDKSYKTADGVVGIRVKDSSLQLAKCAKAFFGDPTSKLKLVGVTGTNGKTSTVTMLHSLFTQMGYKCGMVSTIKYVIGSQEFGSTHTTPDAVSLNRMFAQMVDMGCEYCFMEVSSHAIAQHRTYGLEFDVVLFTNITHDHLDYHKTFDHYLKTKKTLFDNLPKNCVAIYNADDRNGSVMVQNSKAITKSYSLRRPTDYRCRVQEQLLEGMLLEIDNQEIWVKLIGEFNAYNLLSVYAVALELGAESCDTLTVLSTLAPVRGRFETISFGEGSVAVVDYAHTPDALVNVLDTIRGVCGVDKKIITVVGCGGDRDKSKRPIMASIAVQKSDFTIFTSDNPRTENPDAILSDMLVGVVDEPRSSYSVISSRSEAIKMAMIFAQQNPRSVLLVAGKGHETYQESMGVKVHFDDKEEILNNI